ncbi:DUF3046 domain-containing protein [Microcella sp.]|uniref:DUF3046 domain-containing protein n=1 Tax=Microcella sp. TaxID=1913979 RepID=UPI00391963DB
MKLSEFRRAVVDEFGDAYGRSLVRDLVLGDVGDRTAQQALDAGVAPRDVWLALCAATDVPRERWHGAGRPQPRPGQ